MADQIFNRCGAVPGILDAIIVQGDASEASESLAKAKARRARVARRANGPWPSRGNHQKKGHLRSTEAFFLGFVFKSGRDFFGIFSFPGPG
jgi:hypothetical protein